MTERPVKLACRNLWKVYGPQADRLGAERLDRNDGLFGGDRAAACERLRADGHIPAVIDANFDVHQIGRAHV